MSFQVSNLSSGNFVATNLLTTSGNISAVAATSNEVYYTYNYGSSWSLSTPPSGFSSNYTMSASVLYPTTSSSLLNGVIVSNSGNGIWYTENHGNVWSGAQSSGSALTGYKFTSLSMSSTGEYGIAGCSSNGGIWYTTDYGYKWTQEKSGNSFNSVSMSSSGVYALAGGTGIWYSNNNGSGWSQFVTSGTYNSVAIAYSMTSTSYQYGIGGSSAGLYCSSNVTSSSTWIHVITSGSFNSVAISSTGQSAVAGSSAGLYYASSNVTSSTSWTLVVLSNGTSSDSFSFSSVSMDTTGQYIVAGSSNGGGIWYTGDYGSSWTQQYSGNNFNSLSVSSDGYAIAGSDSNEGVYYTSAPLCYEKNVEILCLINNVETYIKICEIEIGMLVKTYKQGYKKVINTKKFNYKTINKNNELECLYKMKDCSNIILTGGHSVLEDELIEKQKNNKFNFYEKIEDKYLILTCFSDKFEKITEDNEYELCHIVLENENKNEHYGIYITNNVLSESCSEYEFNKKFIQ